MSAPPSVPPHSDTDFAKAFQELAKSANLSLASGQDNLYTDSLALYLGAK